MDRRRFLSVAGAAALPGAPRGRQPNIVFIILDDLGYGDLGCYGQKLIRTPNIDRAASEGMRFTDCYAGATVCAPSRSVLMTGLHGGHTPIRANAGTAPLMESDITLASVLQQAGYATGGFGKWGLGDAHSTGTPIRHGFNEFFGYLHQVHAHSYFPEFLWDTHAATEGRPAGAASHGRGSAGVKESRPDVQESEKKYVLTGNMNGKRRQYSADIIAERSFEFVRRNRNRPFFLYACYTLPHAKFEIPSLAPYGREAWTGGQKAYASMVTRADTHVGRILALLGELGLERDTAVFITSDNGAPSGGDKGFELFRSNGRFRGEKGGVYEGGIRVPMIARWPGRIAAGSTSAYVWSFADVLPTLAGIADAKTPPGLDGFSILPTLLGRRQSAREFLYWEFNSWDAKTGRLRPGSLAQAVRTGRWKAVRLRPGAALELYDLTADPSETKDVAAANPEVVAGIEARLKTARTEPRPHNGDMQFRVE